MERTYPSCCTSAFCGRTECPKDCPSLPVLTEFKEWRERTRAVQPDHIWCPTIWRSTVNDGRPGIGWDEDPGDIDNDDPMLVEGSDYGTGNE